MTYRGMRPRRRGFTLLEVMVAMAILGLGLTAIFSAEAGAIRMATRSGKMGMATLLARCKMLEVEEQVMEEGFPAVFASGDDGCCEGAEFEGYHCEWEINPVVLPDAMFAPPEEDEAGLEPGANPDGPPPPGGKDGFNLPLGMGTSPQDILSGAGTGGLASMAMQQVYPILKPSFEAQIRRATVIVHWKEGEADKSFNVEQYLTTSQGVPPDIEALLGGADPNSGAPGAATGPGAAGP